MIQTLTYVCSSNFTPQVKEARNQSQIFLNLYYESLSRLNSHAFSVHQKSAYITASLTQVCAE